MFSPRRIRFTLALLTAGAALGALQACEKAILQETDERSPYDRYDAVRNQRAAQYAENEFGQKRPNLRARLLPKD